MNTKTTIRLQLEALEDRNAPSTLTVTPPAGPATPAASTLAAQGCTSGITAHANVSSSGVVRCS
jgi:hypothetical protein